MVSTTNMLGDIEVALTKAGCPRKVGEIYAIMEKLGLWKWGLNNPHNVIASRLTTDINERGRRSRFAKFGLNCFGLREYKAPSGKKGYVYVLSNPMLKGSVVKVGKAESVLERLISLNSAVPKDYEPEYVLISTYYGEAERLAHALLRDAGSHHEEFNDEFFSCKVSDAKKVLEKVAKMLPCGDNEVCRWSPKLEIRFATLKKGKIPQKYLAKLSGETIVSVAGSSHIGKVSFGVTMPSGVTISRRKGSETFAETIRQLGAAEIAEKFPGIVKKDKSEFPSYASVKDIGDGWFVNVHGSTKELIRVLKKIRACMDCGIEIIEA